MKKSLKLNLGSGSNKIDGFVNIDVELSCKPDLVCNFITDKLPYKASTVDEVVFFHCIEHIIKPHHKRILNEIWRVLKPGSSLILSYPEFMECVKNWKSNYKGLRSFWEKTIFGRQLYPADFHVSLMHTPDTIDLLTDCGFININAQPEPVEKYNTIVYATKGKKPIDYEGLIKENMSKLKVR